MPRILGSRVGSAALCEATFACPNCRAERTYRMFAMRTEATLFAVPLGQIGRDKDPWIACTTCGATYSTELLRVQHEMVTAASTANRRFDAGLIRLLALTTLAGGDFDRKRAAFAEVLAHLVPPPSPRLPGDPTTEERVQAALADAAAMQQTTAAYLKVHVAMLAPHLRACILQACCEVVAAGGQLADPEADFIIALATGLRCDAAGAMQTLAALFEAQSQAFANATP